jgi:Pvc16 N-terminal domain
MNDAFIVRDVTLELRRGLAAAMADVPETGFAAGIVETLSIAPPGSEEAEDAFACLYLHHVLPDMISANRPPPHGPGALPPPLALALHYIFAPCVKAEEPNQIMLACALRAIHDNPVITLPGASVRIELERLASGDLASLWQAFRVPYRNDEAVEFGANSKPCQLPKGCPCFVIPGRRRRTRNPCLEGREQSASRIKCTVTDFRIFGIFGRGVCG